MFPDATPFDLQFSLFRIPVRVIPTFWIVSALLGWNAERLDLVFVWVLCVFFSILFHELGHALTAAAFGFGPHIVLHHFGGYAAFQPGHRYDAVKSLLITLAGPLPQFMLGVAFAITLMLTQSWFAPKLDERTYEYVMVVFQNMIWINVVWSLINLLPVWPLDGGQATRAILEGIGFRDGLGIALKISVGVGALATIGFFQLGLQGSAIMFLLLTMSSIQELQARRW
jgi:Zn-dependent protease